MTPQKKGAIGAIEREFHDLEDRLAGAEPEDYDQPVFADEGAEWRLRDLLAHIAFWQDLAARAAERMIREHLKPGPDTRLRGFMGDPREVSEINAAAVAASRERSIDEIRLALRRAHDRLVDAIRGCPDELLWIGGGPEDMVRVLYVPAVMHLRTHREHIDSALRKEGATTV